MAGTFFISYINNFVSTISDNTIKYSATVVLTLNVTAIGNEKEFAREFKNAIDIFIRRFHQIISREIKEKTFDIMQKMCLYLNKLIWAI